MQSETLKLLAPTGPEDTQPRTGRSSEASTLGPVELRELRHEVGNALAPVLAYAQLLQRRLPAWAEAHDRRALEGIAQGAERARQLLDRTLGDPPVEPAGASADLASILARAAAQVGPERSGDVAWRVDGGPLRGRWDGEQVTQVLVNLLNNAAKYSPPGTPIAADAFRLGRADWVRIVVQDRGIGIDAAALEEIFLGRRTDRACAVAPGSGIGLQLSRRLVEEQGGLLWAMSRPGGGSAFYLELPLATTERASVPSAPTPPFPGAGKRTAAAPRRALVVDDDTWCRRTLADIVEQAGFEVAPASNGRAGLRLARQIRPAVVLLDLALPERSGLDLLRDLKESRVTREIPVIVVSAGVRALTPATLRAASDVIPKPFETGTVWAALERAGREPPAIAGWAVG